MRKIQAYESLTGEIFKSEAACHRRDSHYKCLYDKYCAKLSKFNATLNRDGDESEQSIFCVFRDRLVQFLALSDLDF